VTAVILSTLILLVVLLAGAIGGAILTFWRLPHILSVMTPDQFQALMDRVDAEDRRVMDR
jgi:hypothetical protein